MGSFSAEVTGNALACIVSLKRIAAVPRAWIKGQLRRVAHSGAGSSETCSEQERLRARRLLGSSSGTASTSREERSGRRVRAGL